MGLVHEGMGVILYMSGTKRVQLHWASGGGIMHQAEMEGRWMPWGAYKKNRQGRWREHLPLFKCAKLRHRTEMAYKGKVVKLWRECRPLESACSVLTKKLSLPPRQHGTSSLEAQSKIQVDAIDFCCFGALHRYLVRRDELLHTASCYRYAIHVFKK